MTEKFFFFKYRPVSTLNKTAIYAWNQISLLGSWSSCKLTKLCFPSFDMVIWEQTTSVVNTLISAYLRLR